jgi:three-Cys-motif partner protein
MGHAAGREFFARKRAWSKRKDQILGYYLVPYIPKLRKLRRPVCIVDGFAGPGQFEDGEPGSPLIICRTLEAALAKAAHPSLRALLIEADPELMKRLQLNVARYPFTETRSGRLLDHLPHVEAISARESLFLYLDPFTVEGLEWEALDRVFRSIQNGSSVEVLLNFNVDSFCRRARAILAVPAPPDRPDLPRAEPEDPGITESTDDLDRIVGGNWWQAIAKSHAEYSDFVAAVVEEYCSRLRTRFNETCFHEVREHWRHKIPKYVLVFGSRHPDALEIMNDAMNKSREAFAEESADSGLLFELRPESVVPDREKIRAAILQEGSSKQSRGKLVLSVIRKEFGKASSSQLRKMISELISSGDLASSTGKSRLNDEVDVWRIR